MQNADFYKSPGALINHFTHRPESGIWINQDLVMVVCGLSKEGTVVVFNQDECLILFNLERVNWGLAFNLGSCLNRGNAKRCYHQESNTRPQDDGKQKRDSMDTTKTRTTYNKYENTPQVVDMGL
jgi:hypothetical protein